MLIREISFKMLRQFEEFEERNFEYTSHKILNLKEKIIHYRQKAVLHLISHIEH